MSDHFLKICKLCNSVISQCRCPGPKTIQTGICDICTKDSNLPEEGIQIERSI